MWKIYLNLNSIEQLKDEKYKTKRNVALSKTRFQEIKLYTKPTEKHRNVIIYYIYAEKISLTFCFSFRTYCFHILSVNLNK